MNLTEALDAALPEIPQARISRSRPPQLDSDLIVHEDVLDGEPVIGVLQRGKSNYFRFPPWQWQLAQLFDGERSYEEIAKAFEEQTGTIVDPNEVRAFAEQMDESDFWYKTQQEKNIAMREKLLAQRGRRLHSKINVAHISFSAWDPDRYLDWLDRIAGRFIYSRWCVLAVLLLFVFETAVLIQYWRFIGPDTALFFDFSQKSLSDFAEFWLLIMVIGFFHESAHGLTCKHFGGQVHSMGLMFLYLVPCFFVDVTESWVSATKIQRLGTIIAGIWIELVMCGIAMIFWINSPQGTWVHNLWYAVILLTGIAAVVINLNPLIKLDGYYFLTELIEIPDLKERSTAFLSAWFQAKVLRLPIQVPVVPRRRVVLFVFYAIASGVYSYLLLFFAVRFSYRLGWKWFAEFALIPSAALAFALYRSRLRALRRVAQQMWEMNLKPALKWRPVYFPVAAALVTLLFVPLWRDREPAYFVIEPAQSHTICAAVPGRVEAVLVREGQRVRAGEVLLRMTSYKAAGMRSKATAEVGNARFKAFDAEVQGRTIGAAMAEQDAAQRLSGLADEAQSSLEVRAPAEGTILTQNPALLRDADVGSGQTLISLAEGTRMVRLFVPATALERIPRDAEVKLALPGRFSQLRLRLSAVSGEPVDLPAGIIAAEKYKGMTMPVFYNSVVPVPVGAGDAMYGMAGRAMIFGMRRSLANRATMAVSDIVRAHVW